MSKNLITIGITCYREGKWLQECWDSVLSQTDNRWEAIMILDGGADEATRDIFEKIAHPRLTKYSLKTNVKQYLTRTLAILNSKTDWYAHLDGDDLLPKNAVSLIIEAIKKNPEARFVFGECKLYNTDTNTHSTFRKLDPDEDDLDMVCLRIARTSPIKKDLFFELGGFTPALLTGAADLDFWISVAERSIIGSRADGEIYIIRSRQGSVTQTRNITYEEIYNTIYNRHPKFFSQSKPGQIYIAKAFLRVARQFLKEGKEHKAFLYKKKALELASKFDLHDEILDERRLSFKQRLLNRIRKFKFINKVVHFACRKFKKTRS
jgi:glycosyltransferase involved in cell wall biosynthesis